MTENRRIVLNMLATYSRSLFSLVCAVFTSRWVLMALGDVDYGLNGVVGSLLTFLAFVNCVMAGGSGRFYAIAIGKARVAEDKAAALEECRRWFSIAVAVHVTMAVLFAAVCWPVGEWAVRNWLTIPANRVADCVEVFRLSCFACVVGMVTLPFSAMYVAKQEIGEVTFFAVAVTVFLVVLSRYMVTHPGDWLVPFARWTCVSACIPCLVYAVHGFMRFPECRVRLSYMADTRRLRELLTFVGWGFFGPLGMMLRAQGAMVLVNRMFNPSVNASWALSRTVSDKSNTLAESIKGAMVPALVQACGAGDMERMHALVARMCKFSLAAAMLVAVPLLLEMPEVLRIWLKDPPPRLVGLAFCVLMEYLLLVSTSGYDTAVYAKGRLARYQCITGVFLFSTLPAMYVAHRLGGGVYAVAGASLLMIAGYCGARLVVASRIVGMRVRDWLVRTALPVVVVALAAAAVGSIPVLVLPSGWQRVLVTAFTSVLTFVALLWQFALDDAERLVARRKMRMFFGVRM